ncbi:hypothetical protein LTR95_013973 [Oleoguttula sp. CCFEE 5521]
MVDVTMTDAPGPGRPSLDRLKALDSLASLEEQLKEANELCNIGHRAQMILKWLSGKLQSDSNVRGTAGCWTLLERCVRIISPQTMSTLLARSVLIDVVQSAVAELDGANLKPTLSAITQMLETLTSISQGESGAGVKRLLSTDGVNAAGFFQVWTRRVLEVVTESHDISTSTRDAPSWYVGPAITIWKLRRPSTSDNASFAEHCLVPCALMLRRVQHDSASSVSSTRKRAPGVDSLPVSDIASELERLLARHVFLPVRAGLSNVQIRGDSAASTTIDTTFKALKDASGDQKMHRQVAPVVLQLLRVAPRCVQLQNSQQQVKERTYIEAVFLSLLDCLVKDKAMANVHTVAEMLANIGARTSLSVQIIRNVVRQYCRLGDDDEVFDPDLDLIAAVVKLDANAFVDVTLLDQLFRLLMSYDASAWKGPGNASACTTSGLKERILFPVLTAYAKARRLEEFITQWHLTLSTCDFANGPSIFTEMHECLVDVLEVRLTSEQIASLVSQYRAPMSLLKEEGNLRNPSLFRASAVISNAVLQGIRSDDVLDHLHEQLGLLLSDLQSTDPYKLVATAGPDAERLDAIMLCNLWSLLKQTLQLWLARWASQQRSEQQVVDRLHAIRESAIVRFALTDASQLHPTEHQMRGMPSNVEAAQILLGVLDYWQHDQQAPTCYPQLERQMVISTMAAISQPALLGWQTSQDIEDQVDQLMDQIKELASKTSSSKVAKSTLITACTAVLQTRGPATRVMIDRLISELATIGTYDSRHEAVVTLLNGVPVASLSYTDRKTMINGLVDSLAAEDEHGIEDDDEPEGEKGDGDEDESHAGPMSLRLSLLARLLHLDAEAVWRLQANMDSKADPAAYGTYLKTVDLFVNIVNAVLERQQATYPKSPAFAKQLQRVLRGLDERDVARSASEPLCYYVLKNAILRMVQQAAGVPDLFRLIEKRGADFSQDASRKLRSLDHDVDPKTVTAKSKGVVVAVVSIRCDTLLIYLSSPTLSGMHALKSAAVTGTMREVITWCRAISAASQSELSAICARTALQAYKVAAFVTPDVETRTIGLQLFDDRQPAGTRDELAALLRASATKSTSMGRPGSNDTPMTAGEITAIQHHISAMSKAKLTPDDEYGVRTVYASLLATQRDSPAYIIHRAATSCMLTILTDKSFLVNQHLAELTLSILHHLSSTSTCRAFPLVYLDTCTLFSVLLKHHRAKLHDRLHLLIPVLESLLIALFTPIKPSVSTFRNHKPLGTKQARSFTRLLSLLCNPPAHHSHKAKAGTNNLIDTSRVARRHIGSFVPLLLHTYCARILTGTLGEGVREVLQPGLWAMVEAMESYGPDVVRALSAGMNGSERLVLRTVYGEWKRVGKWEGA